MKSNRHNKTRNCSIREITTVDIPQILQYMRDASDEDRIRKGEPMNRVDEIEIEKFLKWFCESRPPLEEAGEDILIWEINGKTVGYSTLKQFKIPDYGQIHIHMWDKNMRGKGYGAILFCLSALEFRKKYKIRELFCAPKCDNPMPNQMLKKIGFPIVENSNCIDWVHSDGIRVKQNKYLITDCIILRFLNSVSE